MMNVFRRGDSVEKAMRKTNVCRAGLAAILISIAVSGHAQNTLDYNREADPFALVDDAKVKAADEDKHVLIVAGGDWCIWCHYLDAFLAENADVGKAFKDTFVVVKAYIGDQTDNEAFFATLPAAVGYPHFWVLASDGEVLVSQNTLPLEDGDKSYDRGEFMAFIASWQETLDAVR